MKRLTESVINGRIAKFIFFIIWVSYVFMSLSYAYRYNLGGFNYLDWGISDWLINYEGGFVRRGLTGQVLIELYRIHPYDIRMLIFLITILSSVAFLCIICFLFRKKKWGMAILPLGCCFFFTFVNLWARKDMLLLILVFLIFYSYKNYMTKKTMSSLIMFEMLSVVILLIHEASFFFFFPLLVAYSYAIYTKKLNRKSIDSVLKHFLPFVPALLTMFLVCFFKGNDNLQKIVWHSWNDTFQSFPDGTHSLLELQNKIGSGVSALSWKTVSTFKGHLVAIGFGKHPICDYKILVASIVLWVWMMVDYYFIVSRLNTITFSGGKAQHTELEISNTLILQFLFMIPMFTVLSCDFGRTIPYWIFSSLMAVACFGKLDITSLSQISNHLQRPFKHPFLCSKLAYSLLVLSVPLVNCWTPTRCLQIQLLDKIFKKCLALFL